MLLSTQHNTTPHNSSDRRLVFALTPSEPQRNSHIQLALPLSPHTMSAKQSRGDVGRFSRRLGNMSTENSFHLLECEIRTKSRARSSPSWTDLQLRQQIFVHDETRMKVESEKV